MATVNKSAESSSLFRCVVATTAVCTTYLVAHPTTFWAGHESDCGNDVCMGTGTWRYWLLSLVLPHAWWWRQHWEFSIVEYVSVAHMAPMSIKFCNPGTPRGAVGGMLGAYKQDTLIDLEFASKFTTKPMKADQLTRVYRSFIFLILVVMNTTIS